MAVSAADITDYFSIEMFKGITAELEKHGFNTILLNSANSPQKEKQNILSFDTDLLAGLIIQPLTNNLKFLKSEIKDDFPIVLLDREIPETNWSSIVTNNLQITRDACRYFKQQKNISKIILVADESKNVSTIKQRIAGIKEVYDDSELQIIDSGKSKTSFTRAYKKLKQAIKQNPQTLIFAIKERWLIEILPRLMYAGLIGKHQPTLMTGFSDSNLINIINPTIKVIRQYPFKMGETAGKVLLKQLKKPDNSNFKRIEVPASFDRD